MKMKTSVLLVAVLMMVGLSFQAAPAEGQYFPQRWSLLFYDTFGFLFDCVDFAGCDEPECRAHFEGSDFNCVYDNNDEFTPGRMNTTITCLNVDFPFYGPTRRVEVDLACSRIGTPFYGVNGFPIGSCGGVASYIRIDPFGANVTINEGWSGVAIASRKKCSTIFTAEGVERLRLRRRLPR